MTSLDPGLVARVRDGLATAPVGGGPTPRAVVDLVRGQPAAPTDGVALLRLGERLYQEIVGFGPLTGLIADPAVTDVLVNGPGAVWIDRGVGLEPVPGVGFADADELRRFAARLAAACGRRLDDASPYVDVRLTDGTRLHAVLPPVAVHGPYLSLRTLRRQALGLATLVELGTLTADSARLVDAIVRARLAFVVAGGTGSGKTTLLGTLLGLVPPHERIVVVEEAPEFKPHVLNALRQPLEDRFVVIARTSGVTRYPAEIQLVLAANPCPCGQGNEKCSCSSLTRRRYLGRLSGPLMDRVDLQVTLDPVKASAFFASAEPPEPSAQVLQRVVAARATAAQRWAGHPFQVNAAVPGTVLRSKPFRLPATVTESLSRLMDQGNLSARGYDRVLRVAWTIVDIDGRTTPGEQDIREALELRQGEPS